MSFTAQQKRVRAISRDKSGVALIEFAMVFPILITMYLGGFQLMDAVSVYRKVSTVTRSMADLTTQVSSLSESEVQTYLDASAQIMSPAPTSRGTFRVSMIKVAADGTTTVLWSRSKNGTQLTKNATYVLPASVKQANVNLIVCDVTYNYHPLAFFGLMGDIPFTDQVFMLPRNSTSVDLKS